MTKFDKLKDKIYLIAVAAAVVIILLPLGYSIVSNLFASAARGPQPFLERPDEKYKECVRDTEFMRLHHWELLRAVREEVVRYGKRGEIGISKCRECHVSRERFCDRCHNSVNLKPDCFGCHYFPEPSQVAISSEELTVSTHLPGQSLEKPIEISGE